MVAEKKRSVLFCILILIFLFSIKTVYSLGGGSGSGGAGDGSAGSSQQESFNPIIHIPKMNVTDLLTNLQNGTITNETIRYIVETQITQEVLDLLIGRYHYLSADELNKVLERNNINTIRVKADGSTKYIEITDTGFKADYFETLALNDVFFTNVENIVLDGNNLGLDHSNAMIIGSRDYLIDIFDLSYHPESFSVEYAEMISIQSDFGFSSTNFFNVTDSTFKINGIIEVEANGKVDYHIEDYRGNYLEWIANERGKLTLVKDLEVPVYNIKRSELRTSNEIDLFLKRNLPAPTDNKRYTGDIAVAPHLMPGVISPIKQTFQTS